MAGSGNGPYEQAKALYRKRLTEESTWQIRNLLQTFVGNPGDYPSGDQAYGWSLLANIKLCDYLNRWNKAEETELTAAASHINSARVHEENHPFADYAEGFLYRARGDHAEAQRAFQKSIEHGGAARARAQHANEFVYLGDPDAAVQEIDREIAAETAAGASHPALGMFQWIKGRALFFAGEYEKAIPCFRQSIESWQKLWYNRLYLVSAYALTSRQRKAYQELRDFHEHFRDCTTIAQVKRLERSTRNETLFVVVGRRNFQTGLRLAGMI